MVNLLNVRNIFWMAIRANQFGRNHLQQKWYIWRNRKGKEEEEGELDCGDIPPPLQFNPPFPFRSTDTNQIERCKCPLMRTMDDDFTLDNEDA